jgi:glucan phosphoethanolaminetransferase (alkaline phosphatase superfamily)
LSAYTEHTLTRIFADKMIIIRPKYKKNLKIFFVPWLLTQIEFIGVKKRGSKISHLGPFNDLGTKIFFTFFLYLGLVVIILSAKVLVGVCAECADNDFLV